MSMMMIMCWAVQGSNQGVSFNLNVKISAFEMNDHKKVKTSSKFLKENRQCHLF